MTTRIQLRRGTATEWANANPVLALGEAGIETNTLQWKVGDGTTAWANLSYMSANISSTYGNSNVAAFLSNLGSNVILTTGNITGGNINTSGVVSATGNVRGANFNTTGLISATGNVTGGNILTAGRVSATGNVSGDYILGNGSQLTGISVSTGNIGFTGDAIYDLYGITLENADLSHGATAALILPSNGSNTDPIQLNNTYGNITIGTGPSGTITSTWRFDTTGNLVLPSTTSSINYSNGAPYGGGGGGNVDTGNIGFDNYNIYNTQGQGVVISNFNYATDEAETAYVNIPAGNTASDLQVVQEQGNVTVAANTKSWTFNSAGNLVLPDNTSSINYANGQPYGAGGGGSGTALVNGNNSLSLASDSTATLTIATVAGNAAVIEIQDTELLIDSLNGNVTISSNDTNEWIFDTTSILNLPDGTKMGAIEGANTFGFYNANENTEFLIELGPTNVWDFNGNTGTLTTPGNIVTGGVSGNITGANVIEANTFVLTTGGNTATITEGTFVAAGPTTVSTVEIAPANPIYSPEQRLVIYPTAGEGNHLHLTSGNLQVTDVFLGDDNQYIRTRTDGGMSIGANGGEFAGGPYWTFDAGGNTSGPLLNTARGDTSGGSLYGYTLRLGAGDQEAVITTPDGTAGSGGSSQRLVINPGAGQAGTGGEGGDIYLWAGRGGDTNGNGGDIKIRGGYGPGNGQGGYIRMEGGEVQGVGTAGYIELLGGTNGGGTGGYITITGGPGSTYGGDSNIVGGYGSNNNGGNVNIIGGGSGQGLGSYGNVNITAGASSWQFNNNGNLTVPTNTWINSPVGSNGNINLHPDGNGLVRIQGSNDILLEIVGDTANSLNRIEVDTFGDLNFLGGTFTGRFARGTQASPQAVQGGDRLAAFRGKGYDGAEYPRSSTGMIAIEAHDTWSPGNCPTQISFLTTAYNNTEPVLNMELTPNGNLTIFNGNINLLEGGGHLVGNINTGDGALYAGLPAFTILGSNVVAQFSGNANSYSQINFQNISNGTQASGDFIITANNGDDSNNFIDMGIAGNTWDGSQPNSLGTDVAANDGYLYVNGGNLVVGVASPSPVTWTFDSTGNLTTPGTAGDIIMTGGNVTGARMVVTTPTVLANLTATAGARAFASDANLIAAGNFGAQVSGGAGNTVPVWSDGSNWYIG